MPNKFANMRYFLWLAFLILSKYGNSQQVSRTFDKPLIIEEFETQGNRWESRYSAIELLVIQDNVMILKRITSSGFSVAIPSDAPYISKAEIITALKFSTNTPSTGGIILWANQTGKRTLLLEINEKGKFRLKKVSEFGISIISKNKKEGWVKSKGFKKNAFNTWSVKAENGIMDIYLNGKFQQTFSDEEITSGRIGYFVNAGSSIQIDFLRINGTSEDLITENNPDQNSGEIKDIVQLFRSKIEDQQKDLNKLQQDLAYCKSKSGIDTSARKANLDLTRKNTELSKKVIQLEQELEIKKKRLSYLESMKEDLEKSQNGDLIINLTDLLAKEKKDHAETRILLQKLTDKNTELQKELDSLKK